MQMSLLERTKVTCVLTAIENGYIEKFKKRTDLESINMTKIKTKCKLCEIIALHL